MKHKIDPENLKPCPHMRTLVSAWTDGALRGLPRWYTEAHVKGCPQCQASLPFLRTLRARVGELAETGPVPEPLTETRRQTVEGAWEQAESVLAPPPE